jgi:hypothetical protein
MKHNWKRTPEFDRPGRVYLYAFLCDQCKTLYLSIHSDFRDIKFYDKINIHEDCALEIVESISNS